MNDIWEILGIEPTDNKREIRAAYAAKARECHPEEDAEAFAVLNQAYQRALAAVSGQSLKEGVMTELMPEKITTERKNPADIVPAAFVQDTLKESRSDTEEQSGKHEDDTADVTLLERLQQAEDKKIEDSMEKGALKRFISIFEKAKETGKFPRADVWKEFFLSEDFLSEQFSDEFAEGMKRYLADWSMAGNYNMYSLPDSFLTELAVAYAIMPEKNNLAPSSERMVYQANETGFKAREAAADLWNMQRREYMPVRILYKPENLVRLRAFSDYMRLKSMNESNLLSSNTQDKWYELLMCGASNHMYELKGKGQNQIYETTRSTALITLYIFWMNHEDVPKCVLECMYKTYNLKDIEKSSSKKLYGPLKQAILAQYPDVEEVLSGGNSMAQMISNWYRRLSKIISDGEKEYDYRTGSYEEPEQLKERIRELFECAEWTKIRNSAELLNKIYLAVIGRKNLPQSLAERLYSFYYGEDFAGYEDEKEGLLDELVQLSFNRFIKELCAPEPILFNNTNISDIADDNREFWHYYLTVGFGFRKARFDNKTYRAFVHNDYSFLPAYMKCMYYPSLQWQKEFTRFDEIKGNTAEPAGIEFTLPDKKRLRVEFHLHYCLYFLDGSPVYDKKYTFAEFQELSALMSKTEHFFFLLAITSIEEQECPQAQEVIETWLSRLPLYPHTVSRIAQMLAADNSDEGAVPGNTEAVYYTEQEKFCFKAVVTDTNTYIYNMQEFGWDLKEAEYGKSVINHKEGRHSAARNRLARLVQPGPVSIGSVSFNDMTDVQKAENIVELLVRQGKCGGRNENTLSYEAWWKKEEMPEPANEFLTGMCGCLTENYCILYYGAQKKIKELFYFALCPFILESSEYSFAYRKKYRSKVEELSKKIKEKHTVVGCFGTAGEYSDDTGFVPEPFAIGESGTYYLFDIYHMCKANNLAELIAKKLKLSNVTGAEGYEGLLSVSNLDGSFEYCYDSGALLESSYSPLLTDADVFTRFTKAEMMVVFARWMDEILSQDMSGKDVLCFAFRWYETCSLDVYEHRNFDAFDDNNPENANAKLISILNGQPNLIWKIWGPGRPYIDIVDEFTDILHWYMECGKQGMKLKNCLRIDCIVLDEEEISEGGILYHNNLYPI